MHSAIVRTSIPNDDGELCMIMVVVRIRVTSREVEDPTT
jgi:hypothetical protein